MEDGIVYMISEKSLDTVLQTKLEKLVNESVFARYEYPVDSHTACQVLEISDPTLRRYLKARKLQTLDIGGRNIRFSLRYLLEIKPKIHAEKHRKTSVL